MHITVLNLLSVPTAMTQPFRKRSTLRKGRLMQAARAPRYFGLCLTAFCLQWVGPASVAARCQRHHGSAVQKTTLHPAGPPALMPQAVSGLNLAKRLA